VLATT
jgi:hypothetical protein